MLIYISGKITGNDNYRNDFAKAEYLLRLKGHNVINTAKVGDSWQTKGSMGNETRTDN